MGAIIDPVQLKRIGMLVDKGVAEGAEKFQPRSRFRRRDVSFRQRCSPMGTSSTVATEESSVPCW